MNVLFLSTMVLNAGYIYRDTVAATAVDFSSISGARQAAQAVACSVVTCLGFSGALPASLAALRMGPVVFKVYDLTLSTMKDAQEPGETTFYCNAVYCRDGCS